MAADSVSTALESERGGGGGGVEEVVCVCVYEPFYKVIVLYLFVLGYLVTQAFISLWLC